MGNTTSAPPFFTRAPDPTHVHPMRASDVAQIEADLCTRLPVELTHAVLEYAGVWAACRRECRKPLTARARVIPRGRRGLPPDGEWGTGQEGEARELGLEDDRGNLWCLLSAPVGCIGVGGGGGVEEGEREGENVWVRKIVVETTSKDQGWADDMENYGTYDGFSWFDASLWRDGAEVPDSRCEIQHNVVAGQYFKEHAVELDATHPLVRAARAGDVVVLWARAQYPGWENNVRYSAMTVYTALYA